MSFPLPIHERFHTFQGEGVYMGCPAFFIRTFGCPVQCPWCDSAGTWHPSWVPQHVERIPVAQLVQEHRDGPEVDFVVITGGEPAVHDLTELTEELACRIHLETSGTFPIRGTIDWITLSPKKWRMPLRENVQRAHEFKVIVEQPSDIKYYSDAIGEVFSMKEGKLHAPIWLHPEWGHREDPVTLGAISDAVKEGRGRFRAGWQIHKPYRVDSRDARTQVLVPLGGDLRKGY